MSRRNLDAARPLAIGLALALVLALAAGSVMATKNSGFLREWPVLENKPPVSNKRLKEAEERAQEILDGLTLDQKIGQITQGEIEYVTAADVEQYCLGSVLSGGGSWPNGNKNSSPQDWRDLADEYWQAGMDGCGIPPTWGIDSVHGNNNVMGATLFPHNINLGAANNRNLMKKIGVATAKETRVTGQPWTFAPSVAVARDDRWGRTYESYSEDPKRVERLTGPMIKGLQGRLNECSVMATIKHWVGDGGTTDGEDQGNTEVPEDELINIHGLPYFEGMEVGVVSAMPSFSSWNGEKMHGNKYLITDILKDTLGFSGHIISDWNGIGQVPGCENWDCPQAVEAGIDQFMVPSDWQRFIETTTQQVEDGIISMDRIDDAVFRVLRNKLLLRLFDKKPSEGNCAKDSLLGKKSHRKIAEQAARESLVLLKNNDDLLPLARGLRVLVTGKSADSISNQTGGWTLTWQGTENTNADFPGATSIYGGIKAVAPNSVLVEDPSTVDLNDYDVAIAVIGETPYAEGAGDIGRTETLQHTTRHEEDLTVLQALDGIPTVTIFLSGRPLYVNDLLNLSQAFVAAFLPGSEGQAVAQVIFQNKKGKVNHDFKGTLPMTWPAEDCQTPLNVGQQFGALFNYDYGLTYKHHENLDELPDNTGELGCGSRDDGDNGDTATEPLEIYVSGSNVDPWVLKIGDPSGDTDVGLGASEITELPNIKTGPKEDGPTVQGAATNVLWKGGDAQFYSQYPDGSEDLRSYLNVEDSDEDGALVFAVKIKSPPTADVETRIDCDYPCSGAVDTTSAFTDARITDGDWHELSIPLACFAEAGTDFSIVNTPFLIFTDGEMEAAISDIRWEPPGYGANVTCDGDYQP